MLVAILCTFAPGAYSHAKELRLEHYAFLREVRKTIVEGGPLLGPDKTPTGMLIVVDVLSVEDARAFIAKEPYNSHGFFESVQLRVWSHVIPEPHPGFIEEQYQSELSSRSH